MLENDPRDMAQSHTSHSGKAGRRAKRGGDVGIRAPAARQAILTHSHVSRWGKTLKGAGLRGECRGDKCNCSIMDSPGGLSLEGEEKAGREEECGGRIHQEPLI